MIKLEPHLHLISIILRPDIMVHLIRGNNMSKYIYKTVDELITKGEISWNNE